MIRNLLKVRTLLTFVGTKIFINSSMPTNCSTYMKEQRRVVPHKAMRQLSSQIYVEVLSSLGGSCALWVKSQSTFSGLQIKCSEVSLTSGSEMGRTYSQNESSTSSHMTMQAREMRRMKSLPSIFRPRSSITHLGLEELPHPERLPQAGERHGCLHPCSHPPCKGVLSASCGAIKYRPHQKEVRQKA